MNYVLGHGNFLLHSYYYVVWESSLSIAYRINRNVACSELLLCVYACRVEKLLQLRRISENQVIRFYSDYDFSLGCDFSLDCGFYSNYGFSSGCGFSLGCGVSLDCGFSFDCGFSLEYGFYLHYGLLICPSSYVRAMQVRLSYFMPLM